MENKLLEILGYAGNDVEGMVLCKFFRLCVLTIPSGKAAPDVDVYKRQTVGRPFSIRLIVKGEQVARSAT